MKVTLVVIYFLRSCLGLNTTGSVGETTPSIPGNGSTGYLGNTELWPTVDSSTDTYFENLNLTLDYYVFSYPIYLVNLTDAHIFVEDDHATQQFLASIENIFLRDVIKMQLSNCPLAGLCGHSLNVQEGGYYYGSCCSSCSCNISTCFDEGDCCPDVMTEETIQSLKQSITQCVPGSLKLNRYGGGIVAISKCPALTDVEMRFNCSRDYTDQLVALYDVLPCSNPDSQQVFRNKYCALCNGVNLTDLEYFQVALTGVTTIPLSYMTDTSLVQRALSDEGININFYSTETQEIYTRTCTKYVDTCNITGNWTHYDKDMEMACKMYTSTIYLQTMRFKNIFCAFCNGIEITDIYCVKYSQDNVITVFGFSGLLKLNVLMMKEEKKDGNTCNKEQFYDELAVSNNMCILVNVTDQNIISIFHL